jgi:ubiquinol-cytochrome c reductase cytochrome b subunit
LHQIYRHSVKTREECIAQGEELESNEPLLTYFPYQSARNVLIQGIIIGIVAYLAWTQGAPLDAPADDQFVSEPRPEWYFRWLFELRRHFTHSTEPLVTMVLPALLLAILLIIPLLDHWMSHRSSVVLRTIIVLGGLFGWGWLTYQSFHRDLSDPAFMEVLRENEELARRARQLADARHVSPAGPQELLRTDPKTQGPILFKEHCAGCHSFVSPDGVGYAPKEQTASNLWGFGRPDWIAGMLDPEKIKSIDYLGGTKFKKGDMVNAIVDLHNTAKEEGDDAVKKLSEDLRLIARALAAEAKLESRAESDQQDLAEIEAGRKLIATEEMGCTTCHKFGEAGELGSAPDLTGYASREWLRGIIADPAEERFYLDDKNDRMPAFAADKAHPELNTLSNQQLDLLVEWMRGNWLEQQPSK